MQQTYITPAFTQYVTPQKQQQNKTSTQMVFSDDHPSPSGKQSSSEAYSVYTPIFKTFNTQQTGTSFGGSNNVVRDWVTSPVFVGTTTTQRKAPLPPLPVNQI